MVSGRLGTSQQNPHICYEMRLGGPNHPNMFIVAGESAKLRDMPCTVNIGSYMKEFAMT